MKHYDLPDWLLYVKAQLPSERMAEMELHLYRCDPCLAQYMTALEHAELIWPQMQTDDKSYMDTILDRTLRTRPAWYRSTLFHYGIAAAATIVLVATGFFHGLSQELDSVRNHSVISPPSSSQEMRPISERLVTKTLSWLDTIQSDPDKGGNQP
ncbi:anti-sigma factor [Paenibacillus aestuarii]|uniref:Zinc-finger domain-containing protein n=1 Tax=Paenibacillus aestuarii TaxID=516965 RepID=A0ABW0KDJ6_9BACL|nr:hypothetical protein [Paenibacillus aestuarii]